MTKTLRALQAESSVCLNTIDNLDNLMSDINHGRWEAVMPQVRKSVNVPCFFPHKGSYEKGLRV